MKRLLLLIVFVSLSAFWVGPIVALDQEKLRLPYRFLIPEGYVGWVRIDFNVNNAPPLPVENGYYLVKVPPTGRLRTSSGEIIARGDQYFYISDEMKYQLETDTQKLTCMVQDKFMGAAATNNAHKPYRYFFVGPRAEYEKCKFNEPCNVRDEDGYLKAGPRLFLSKEDLERLGIKHL
jgi:hypothetical protein